MKMDIRNSLQNVVQLCVWTEEGIEWMMILI